MQPINLKKVNVLYATQTGTSYDLAKEFVLTHNKEVIINKFADIGQIQQFLDQQQDCLWLFFISTTGQGDFTYSMKNLWKKMLTKSFKSLNWMKFSIYSFGDRSYGDNFCIAARKFRQRLIGLQAYQVVQIGLGDQQQANGYLQQYRDKWYPNILAYLKQNNLHTENISSNMQNPTSIKISNNNFQKMYQNCYEIKILKRYQVGSTKQRQAFLIDLELINYPNKIITGDVLNIYPLNSQKDVNFLMKYFKLSEQSLYEVKTNQNNKFKIRYIELFRKHLNISSIANHSFLMHRSDLKNLSQYSENILFKQKLQQLYLDYQQYHNYIKKYKRTIIQILIDFDLKIPIYDFIQRCGSIIPRKYSITQIKDNKQQQIIQILFRIHKQNINNRVHLGRLTHDIGLQAQIGDIRIGNIVKGQFQYVQKANNNIIMISIGTGIAPFMQFMQMALQSTNKWNILLFYTNRYNNQIYFQSHLQSLVAQNKLNPFLSFTGQGGKRIIRLVEDNIHFIQQMMDNNQFKIMVCGPKEMCQGVQNILERKTAHDFKNLRKKRIFLYQNW